MSDISVSLTDPTFVGLILTVAITIYGLGPIIIDKFSERKEKKL